MYEDFFVLSLGEYIKNWRARWFVVRKDGSFQGFKQKPAPGVEPLNNFKIERESPLTLTTLADTAQPCQDINDMLDFFSVCVCVCVCVWLANVNILANDKLKKNAFVIR